jgi:hypothetical protein
VVKQLFGLHETQERDGANAISGASNPELSLTFFLSRTCSAGRMRRRKRRRRRRTLWMILVSKWMHNGSI